MISTTCRCWTFITGQIWLKFDQLRKGFTRKHHYPNNSLANPLQFMTLLSQLIICVLYINYVDIISPWHKVDGWISSLLRLELGCGNGTRNRTPWQTPSQGCLICSSVCTNLSAALSRLSFPPTPVNRRFVGADLTWAWPQKNRLSTRFTWHKPYWMQKKKTINYSWLCGCRVMPVWTPELPR